MECSILARPVEIRFKRFHELRNGFPAGRILEGCIEGIHTDDPDDAITQLLRGFHHHRPTHGMSNQDNFSGANAVYHSRHNLFKAFMV